MTGDVRAAAERLREHRRVCLAMRHPMESPYTHLEVSTGAAEMVLAAEQKDLLTLANAYLAEHPADDGEPVTEEWLRAVGVTDNPLRDALEVGPAQLWHFKEDVLGIDHHTGFWTLPTRGHVRRLCAALGIPLAEPKGA